MSVLVTGASGFIGRHLVAELERRQLPLRVPARRDLGPDTDWSDALHGVESVVHLAAAAHERARRAQQAGDYEVLRRVNALGSERLAQAAARAGARRFVFVSTIGVHGEQTSGRPFSEANRLEPASLYAKSKLEAEQLLGEVSSRTGLALAVLRPTLVYGPHNPGNFLRLLRWIDRGWPLPLASVGNRRNLTYVDNLVSAIATLLACPPVRDTFIVCDPQPISTPELICELARGLNRPARLFRFPPAALILGARLLGSSDVARRIVGSLEADPAKIRGVLGWQAPVDTRHGLRETARWYRAQRPLSP